MDELLLVLGLALLAVPVAIIFLFVSTSKLKTRLDRLDRTQEDLLVKLQELADRAVQPERTDVSPPEPETVAPKAEATPAVAASPWEISAKAPTSDTPDEIPERVEAQPEIESEAQPRAFVFRRERFNDAINWLTQNWFLAIAALSLALAGVFLVQYGVERGLLTPFWRVIGAAGLGVALIWFAEVLRRRWGDEDGSETAFLPSTFAGAGLVALFAAVLAARQLYGLIGPEAAFALLVIVAILAVALGWFYGPFLAVSGILAAMAAPFLVGGSSDTPQIYFYYFALIAFAGLLVDALRRWAWVSVFALGFAFLAAWLIYAQGAGDQHFLAFALLLTLGAAAIPPLTWMPRHSGPMMLEIVSASQARPTWPEFPTRLATGTFAAAVVVAVLVAEKDGGVTEVWAAIGLLAALFLLATLWFERAPALTDTALLPPIAFLIVLILQGESRGSLYPAISATAERPPESPAPLEITVLVAMALIGSALAFLRSQSDRQFKMIWAGGAALFAPLTVVVLELLFQPSGGLGAGRWAAHAIIVAAAMTYFAERAARQDRDDLRRAALLGLAALTMISFALILMLSDVALTFALAVMVLLATAIDRRLGMPPLALFVQIGTVVVGFRLVFYPGVIWAVEAPLWEVWLAYGGVIALLSLAWTLLSSLPRQGAIVVVESAVWTLAGVGISVLLFRWFDGELDSHWGMSLMVLIWLISMANQLYRTKVAGLMRRVRFALAGLFALPVVLGVLLMATEFNPLLRMREIVQGPPIFDTLLVAYGFPALVFAVIAVRLGHLPRWMTRSAAALSAVFAVLYVGLEIRRAWRGDQLAVPGTTDGELYSYTLAMLITSVALLFLAFSRRSVLLRRIAMIGVALTIAKVFLVDMSGLAGLVRVASFLGLGLSLAGLAWVNRKMTEQWDPPTDPAADEALPD